MIVELLAAQVGDDSVGALRADYLAAAQDLSEATTVHAPRRIGSHWLCQMLASVADALDMETYLDALGKEFRLALEHAGLPRWAAGIVTKLATKRLATFIGAATGIEHLKLALRILAAMVCPDPQHCPAQDEASIKAIQQALEADETPCQRKDTVIDSISFAASHG